MSDWAMDYSQFQDMGIVAIIVAIVVYVILFIIGIYISYRIVRAGVRRGMRDHYEWVERQQNPPF